VLEQCMSRCPDYPRLLEPYAVGSADAVILPGTKQRLESGCVGDVFRCQLRQPHGEEAVMKTPIADLITCLRNGSQGSTNQRWLKQPCSCNPGFFYLFNEAFPSRVLALRPSTSSTRARLDLCDHQRGTQRQLWKLDAQGHLICKFRSTSCLAVSKASAEGGASVKLEQIRSPCRLHQTWSLQSASAGSVFIVSALNDYVMDVAGDSHTRELYYLSRWRHEPGLVQLRHAVLGASGAASTIIVKRLGKQLGPGTQPLERTDCVIRDIQEGRSIGKSPAQAAQQLLAVACCLRRMHLDGYTHNDLHSGNVLRNGESEAAPFSIIDLGSTSEAGAWKASLGMGCSAGWSITRDWRAYAMNFVSLIDGKPRNMWNLIGTKDELPARATAWAAPEFVHVAARPANGGRTQKWTVIHETGQIISRSNGKVLDLSGDDDTTILVFAPHGGSNQRWRVVDGSITNEASHKCLDFAVGSSFGSSGGPIIACAAVQGSESQQWRYDEASGEIVNPVSRMVLDMSGEVCIPEDVKPIIDAPCEAERPLLQQLFSALFSARADPNEICTLVGLLASRAAMEPYPSMPSVAVAVQPVQRCSSATTATTTWGRAREPWRGVNLGGWLLLEPGPSTGLFSCHLRKNGQEALCEYDLMEAMKARGTLSSLREHRDTHITKQDFIQIKKMGLNAVRLPLGYWIVLGPLRGEPYQGPALEYVDRALDWAEEVGLQVLLDLHGCPGGESHDAPCGRRVRPKSRWNWKQWSMLDSLRALEVLAERYRDRSCVTGIEVCNEPSTKVPLENLVQYYDRAVSTVRGAGMTADRVAVVLPAFQRDLMQVATAFDACSAKRHRNYCYDLHHYHCFDWWNSATFGQHLRVIEEHRKELGQFPACVGEWSLAMGAAAKNCRCLPSNETRSLFGRKQREAYDEASHGWFFWNWKDGNGPDWDWRIACGYEQGSLTYVKSTSLALDSPADVMSRDNAMAAPSKLPPAVMAQPPPQAQMSRQKRSSHEKAKGRRLVDKCCGQAKIRVCRRKMAALLAHACARVKPNWRVTGATPAPSAATVETALRRGLLRKSSRPSLENDAVELETQAGRLPRKRARHCCGVGFAYKGCQTFGLRLRHRCTEQRHSEIPARVVAAA